MNALEVTAIVLVAYFIYDTRRLYKRNKKLKNEFSRLKKDVSIEFGASEGSGIELIKKEYPDLCVKDDFRESSEPHSISNGMNDSDRAAKAMYKKETGNEPKA